MTAQEAQRNHGIRQIIEVIYKFLFDRTRLFNSPDIVNTLTADKEKLHQVLNLTKNAVEAYSRDEEVVLEISDTSCGIPTEIDISSLPRPVKLTDPRLQAAASRGVLNLSPKDRLLNSVIPAKAGI